MDRVKLEARYREDSSKHRIKTLKKEGFVPANLCGRGLDSLPLEINLRGLVTAVKNSDAGTHAIFDLNVSGGPKDASGPVMIKEIQKDYLGRRVVHVTMQRVSMSEKLTAPVSVVLQGEPVGVTRDAGILEQVLETIDVRTLPANIPPHLDVDVSEWEIGQVLHARDLQLPADVELVTDPDAVVALVRAPHVHKAVEAEEEVEVAVEAPVEEAPAAEEEA